MTAEAICLDTEVSNAFDLGICKQVGDQLETHYPGWGWMVTVPPRQGVAQIRSMHMDARYGFVIKLTAGYYSASDLAKQAVRAGGEMLERTGMPRSKFEWDRLKSARNKNILDFLTFQR
jgi:hypothetical protein